jgi:hypothetical protein
MTSGVAGLQEPSFWSEQISVVLVPPDPALAAPPLPAPPLCPLPPLPAPLWPAPPWPLLPEDPAGGSAHEATLGPKMATLQIWPPVQSLSEVQPLMQVPTADRKLREQRSPCEHSESSRQPTVQVANTMPSQCDPCAHLLSSQLVLRSGLHPREPQPSPPQQLAMNSRKGNHRRRGAELEGGDITPWKHEAVEVAAPTRREARTLGESRSCCAALAPSRRGETESPAPGPPCISCAAVAGPRYFSACGVSVGRAGAGSESEWTGGQGKGDSRGVLEEAR